MLSRYSAAGAAHQRDMRTQLFAPGATLSKTPLRTLSPYEAVPQELAKHHELYLALLEAGNNDEMDLMGEKVNMLKNLGLRMGTEINKLIKLNDEITNSFEQGKVTLKNTYNKMVIMSQRAGITWRMWATVFAIVVFFFLYVWIK